MKKLDGGQPKEKPSQQWQRTEAGPHLALINKETQIQRHPKTHSTTEIQKNIFSIELNKITTNLQRSPPSLPRLIIGIEKLEFLAHF
jgi:hypothetical protein